MATTNETTIIFNPAAKGEKAKRYVDEIGKLSGVAGLLPTSEPGDAVRLARRVR